MRRRRNYHFLRIHGSFLQRAASVKSVFSNTGDTGMKDHFFQRPDSAKCVFSDLFQTFGRFKYGDRMTCGNVDQCFSVLGIKNAVNGFESFAIFIDFNRGKLGNEHSVGKILLIERKCPRGDEIHACRDIELLQGEALSEGVRLYALNAFGKTDRFE